MKRSIFRIMLLLVPLAAALAPGAARTAHAAIGCTLNNPAQDLKFLYPDMTSYREEVREFPRMPDGRASYAALSERVGGDLDPVYETYETPYTVYTVLRGDAVLGIVHGVNVPGSGGVIQVFLDVDPASGGIRALFFQRLESRDARALRGKEWRARFRGLSLADFYKHDHFRRAGGDSADKVAGIGSPAPGGAVTADVAASLRGVRKNLILLDFFVFDRRFEPWFERAKALEGKRR